MLYVIVLTMTITSNCYFDSSGDDHYTQNVIFNGFDHDSYFKMLSFVDFKTL